jgi:hypothetical protein
VAEYKAKRKVGGYENRLKGRGTLVGVLIYVVFENRISGSKGTPLGEPHG